MSFFRPSPPTRGDPGEQNKTLLKGFVLLRGTCSPLTGLHVLNAMQTLLKPFYSVRLENRVLTHSRLLEPLF